MINWKYVAPRIVLLTAALVGLWFGLDPLLRYALTTAGSRLLGAKVEIGGSQTSLTKTTIRLDNVQVANPDSPLVNLVEAKEAWLDLETDFLLKKKLVVRQGRISGLKFGGPRETSGALDAVDLPKVRLPQVELPEGQIAAFAEQWLRQSANALRQDLEQELESVRLAKELMQRWPAEFESLAARADGLQRRIKELKKLIDNPDHNGLRSLDAYRQAALEMDAVREELLELRAGLKQLPRQAEQDKQALVAAERRDIEHLRRKLLLENLDADTLAQYLLGPEQGRRVDELVSWIEWARQFAPTETSTAEPARGRGITLLFPGATHTPAFLVRSLQIDGEAKLGSELVRFEGTAADLTNEPQRYGRPARLALRTGGANPLALSATLDRTQSIPLDTLEIECPQLAQPRRVLGQPDQFAVAVSPGQLELKVHLELRGSELSGRILLVQESIELTPTLAPHFGGERLVRGMAGAMRDIHRLDAVVEIYGTLQEPQWRLTSNLGHELAAGVQTAFQQELDAGREELARQAEQYIDGQLTRLDRMLAAKEQEVASKLNLGDQDLALLSRQLASRAALPDKLRVPKLPGVDLFRR